MNCGNCPAFQYWYPHDGSQSTEAQSGVYVADDAVAPTREEIRVS